MQNLGKSALLSPSNRPSPFPLSLSAVLDTCSALPGSPICQEKERFSRGGSLGTSLRTSALKTHWMHHQAKCHLSFSRYATHKRLLIVNYTSDFSFISQGILRYVKNSSELAVYNFWVVRELSENSRKLWKYSLVAARVSTVLLVLSNVHSRFYKLTWTWKLFKARNLRQVNIVPRVSMSENLEPEIMC